MIIDSSAAIAILRREPGFEAFSRAVGAAERPRISAATLVEASTVAGPARHGDLDDILTGVEVAPFDREQAILARAAYARYGKGSGSPARLNLGDCFSYALATASGEPLLFTGDDFSHTDVTPAI